MVSTTNEERVNKGSGTKKILTEENKRKWLTKHVNSRRNIRFLKCLHKELKRKDEEDKDRQVIQLRTKIQKRREELTQQLTQQYKDEGKNVNNASTFKNITFWVERMLTDEFGFLPENIENCSLEVAKYYLFHNFEKQTDPIDRDNYIFDKKDEELDAISRLAKHDPQKWVSTMMRLELYKEAKRRGLVGMYQDQNGRFQY